MSSTTCKASENVCEKDELTSQKLSLLQWVVHKIVSAVCATEHTAMIVPWHDERTRTAAFVILPANELFSANKERRQYELPMTTDFDAPLRTQTIITDIRSISLLRVRCSDRCRCSWKSCSAVTHTFSSRRLLPAAASLENSPWRASCCFVFHCSLLSLVFSLAYYCLSLTNTVLSLSPPPPLSLLASLSLSLFLSLSLSLSLFLSLHTTSCSVRNHTRAPTVPPPSKSQTTFFTDKENKEQKKHAAIIENVFLRRECSLFQKKRKEKNNRNCMTSHSFSYCEHCCSQRFSLQLQREKLPLRTSTLKVTVFLHQQNKN